MKRVCLPLDINLQNFNTTNHHDRDPYYIDDDTDDLVIDTEWWRTE